MTYTVQALSFDAQRVRRLAVDSGARDVRIVHTLDGILDQVHPATLIATGTALWEAWSSSPSFSRPDVILGLDAGGILPTVAVAVAIGVPYRLAWKLDLDLPDKRRFTEPHARRTDVFAYGHFAGLRVLIVDDEVTTGATLTNLIATLRRGDAQVAGVACLVEDTVGAGRATLNAIDVPLCSLITL